MFLKVSRKVVDNSLNIKMIVYIVYRYLQNNEKTFKKLKIKIRNDILKFYKNFVLLLYLSIKFNANLFNFNQRFSTTIKTLIFFAIHNVIINH